MELETLKDLYVENLRDLYSAETQILKAMPKMIRSSSHAELQRAFTLHQKQTERQVERLERIFKELGTSPKGKKCVGMEGLIDEGKELISEKPDPDVLDAGLIASAQHVEHYEIAGYGTVRTYAQQLGFTRHAELLQQTLEEEKETDRLLTELAERSINNEAESQADDMPMGRGAAKRGSAKRGSAKRGSGRGATKRGGAAKRGTGRRTTSA